MKPTMNFYYGNGLVIPIKERVVNVMQRRDYSYEEHEWEKWCVNDPSVVRKELVCVCPSPTESGNWQVSDFAPTPIACIDFDNVTVDQVNQRIIHKLGDEIKRKLTTSVSGTGVHAYIETDRVCRSKPEWSAVIHYLTELLGGDTDCGGMLRFEVGSAKTTTKGDTILIIEEDEINVRRYETNSTADITEETISGAQDWATLVTALINANCEDTVGEVGTRGVILLSTSLEKTPRGFFCVPPYSKCLYKQQKLEDDGEKTKGLRINHDEDRKLLLARFTQNDLDILETLLRQARNTEKDFGGFNACSFLQMVERFGIEVPGDE